MTGMAAFQELVPALRPLDATWLSLLWLFASMLLLDFYDISLPRGDSMGVAGALCAAAVVVVGPLWAIPLSLLSAVSAHLIRRRADSPKRLLVVLGSRVCALAATGALLWASRASQSQPLVFVAVPAIYLVVELVVAQGIAALLTGRPIIRLIRGSADSQAPLLAAQWSAAVLLLLTYRDMREWSLIPVVALLLLMRQSYALFLDVRETYRTTVEVLVEAAESQDDRRVGHADRTAALARSIAMKIGLSANEVERTSYAALLHDLGELAQGSDDNGLERLPHPSSADVVRGVEFFDRIEPILRACDGVEDTLPAEESDLLAALIVTLASDIDAAYHPEVGAAHERSLLDQVAQRVTPAVKARVVGAALRLGYRIPAVS